MKAMLLAATCIMTLATHPAAADRNGFGAGLLGGVIGGVIGGAITQPRPPVYVAPPPVYVAPPPVVYERRVYVAPPPVYVPPAQRVTFHPWPGPGFACYEPEPNSVNRAICGSEALSAASLSVQQALYAAIQQTPYNAGPLRLEYSNFLQTERVACSQYILQEQADCIAGMLTHERDVFAGRLTGPFADEAARPVAIHVEIQKRLHAMGLLPGVADGIYGESTRRAIAMWQSGQRRSATGVLSNEEVSMMISGYGDAPAPMAIMAPPPVSRAPAPQAPAPQIDVMQPAAPAAPVTQAVVTSAATDPVGGLREGMAYALARTKLFAAGWQTQFFSNAALTDQDREAREWFIDHRITEVQDCSSAGCKLQFHNGDGRLLYVYTEVGSRASGAYRGAGPSVIAYCMDVDDITCPAPAPQMPTTPVTRQAVNSGSQSSLTEPVSQLSRH